MACILYYFGITRQEIVGEVIAVAYEFPRAKAERTDDKEVRIRLDLTLDVPHEIAEQLELLELQDFEACQYDAEYQRIKMSTSTVLFREGA